MRLNGKTAIITGGGTGIGKAAAERFVLEGANVVITGRRKEKLAEASREIWEKTGRDIDISNMDVSDSDQVKELMKNTFDRYGAIDILFNNAAIFKGIGKTIEDLTEEEWDETMLVNLKGTFLCSKYVIPYMRKSGGGSIVNCSSISGHVGQRKQGAYNAAKGGMEMMTKCMALDFAKDKIRVNCICPAWVECEYNHDDFEKMAEEINSMHPIGRAGNPEEVAYGVLYLASDESLWVTGTSLMIDGGYTAQ